MIPLLNSDDCLKAWTRFKHSAQNDYYAFYSSVLKGITTDSAFMNLPIDDHIVHRGDGVFEALKCIEGRIYLWRAHRDRLINSAQGLGLRVPENLEEIVRSTVKAGKMNNCIIRIFLSRGPGHFSTNPYDSVGEQLYVVSTKLSRMPVEKYEKGARVGRSEIPCKASWLAQLKTCNYLPNVMMKKEAVDRKLDFTIGFDDRGFVTEGSTENLILLTEKNELVRPQFVNILRGTTMARTLHLAEKLLSDGLISSIGEKDFTEEDLLKAKEIMMVGTTLDVLPVTRYEEKPIGTGEVGPVAKQLLKLVLEDQIKGPEVITL